jgi:two-component system, OmpR family, response regulator
MNPEVNCPARPRGHAPKVLVVEDDEPTSGQITRALEDNGFSVEQALNGWEGLSRALARRFDAIVLDIMLPEIDGLAVLSTLRNVGQRVPILLLSALDAVDTRVKGLHAGADDYLVKPFYFAELTARLNVLLRRQADDCNGTTLSVGDLKFDTLSGQVTRRGIAVPLKPRESKLLAFLIQHAGSVVTRNMVRGGLELSRGGTEQRDRHSYRALAPQNQPRRKVAAADSYRAWSWMDPACVNSVCCFASHRPRSCSACWLQFRSSSFHCCTGSPSSI